MVWLEPELGAFDRDRSRATCQKGRMAPGSPARVDRWYIFQRISLAYEEAKGSFRTLYS